MKFEIYINNQKLELTGNLKIDMNKIKNEYKDVLKYMENNTTHEERFYALHNELREEANQLVKEFIENGCNPIYIELPDETVIEVNKIHPDKDLVFVRKVFFFEGQKKMVYMEVNPEDYK